MANPNNNKRKMQYIGPDRFTINHGETGRLVSAQRTNSKHFPSGILLWISKDSGGLFGATDSANWTTLKP